MTLPWKPLSKKQLAEIIADTGMDNPVGIYSADDVYRMAMELAERRREGGPTMTDSMREILRTCPACKRKYLDNAIDETAVVVPRAIYKQVLKALQPFGKPDVAICRRAADALKALEDAGDES